MLTPYAILIAVRLPDEIRDYFRKQGARGGKARAANLSPEQRREIARKAAQGRWARARKKSAKLKPTKSARGEK